MKDQLRDQPTSTYSTFLRC